VFQQSHPPEKKKPTLSHIKREKKNRTNQNKNCETILKKKKEKLKKKIFDFFFHNKVFQEKEI
jgi:hypothetical protein